MSRVPANNDPHALSSSPPSSTSGSEEEDDDGVRLRVGETYEGTRKGKRVQGVLVDVGVQKCKLRMDDGTEARVDTVSLRQVQLDEPLVQPGREQCVWQLWSQHPDFARADIARSLGVPERCVALVERKASLGQRRTELQHAQRRNDAHKRDLESKLQAAVESEREAADARQAAVQAARHSGNALCAVVDEVGATRQRVADTHKQLVDAMLALNRGDHNNNNNNDDGGGGSGSSGGSGGGNCGGGGSGVFTEADMRAIGSAYAQVEARVSRRLSQTLAHHSLAARARALSELDTASDTHHDKAQRLAHAHSEMDRCRGVMDALGAVLGEINHVIRRIEALDCSEQDVRFVEEVVGEGKVEACTFVPTEFGARAGDEEGEQAPQGAPQQRPGDDHHHHKQGDDDEEEQRWTQARETASALVQEVAALQRAEEECARSHPCVVADHQALEERVRTLHGELKQATDNARELKQSLQSVRGSLAQLMVSARAIEGADFRGVDVQGADLSNKSLKLCNLSGCSLSGTRLANSDLTNADLTNADLSDADLANANLTNANLANARLPDNLSSASLSNVDLSGRDLARFDLTHANLSSANLTNARLPNSLSRANLSNVDLSGFDLSGFDLSATNLANANLTNANLANAILTHATLANANLTNANLTDALLPSNLGGVNLSGVDLSGRDFTNCDLSNANLANANLSHATLTGAMFDDATMSGAVVVGVDLGSASWGNVRFEDFLPPKAAQAMPTLLSIVRGQRCELDLKGKGLADEGVAALAPTIGAMEFLTSLNLYDNRIGVKGARALAQSFGRLQQLSSLDLGINQISDEGAAALSQSIGQLANLSKLFLGYNQIGDEGATALSLSIGRLTRLSALGLFVGNRLTDVGKGAIRQAVPARCNCYL